MKKLYLLFFAIVSAYAQNPADRDPSFNAFTLPLGNYYVDYAVLKSDIQKDGKIMLLKETRTGTELVRLDNNKLDTSFNTGTGFKYGAKNFKIQSDGKIVAVGDLNSYNGTSIKNIVRINADGSIDKSFAPPAGVSISGNADFLLQPDGKILIAGSISSKSAVVRLNIDGSLDSSFTPFIGLDTGVTAIRLQSDGKIIAAGQNAGVNKIIRLNANGSLDIDLTPAGVIGKQFDIALQGDGKILVSAAFVEAGNYYNTKLIRMNADGGIDSNFKTNSISGANDIGITKIIIQADGKIIIGGTFNMVGSNSIGIVRLNANGAIDAAFNTGTGANATINDLELLPNGKVLVSGGFHMFNKEAAKSILLLNSDGSRDSSFNNITAGLDGSVMALTVLEDDKIIMYGGFNSYNGKTTESFMRLNSDGSRDESLTFGGLSAFGDGSVKSIAVQKDGKMVVGGDFTGFNRLTTNRIIRLNSDGTRDNTFVIGTGFNYEVAKVIVLPDGKILAGGNFTTYKGNACIGLVRLNSDGSVDATFKASYTGISDGQLPYISDFLVLPDGKILVTAYPTQTRRGLVRLNSDGSQDASFVLDPLVKPNGMGVFVQSDGKIMLSFKKDNLNGFFRLDPNGSLDSSYSYKPINSEYYVTFIAGMQKDDKILVSGYSTTNNQNKFFARLNLDGSYDETFTNVFNNSEIDHSGKIMPQSDGKLIYAGAFSSYAGVPAGRIIRLLGQDFKFVQGQNRLDSDRNGCDGNDIPFSNLKMNISSGQVSKSYIANNTGNYTVALKNGSHTITPVFENPDYFDAVPASITVDFPSQASPFNGGFCIIPNGSHPDLQIAILPLTPARPGFDAKYKIVYSNKGNQQLSGTVSFDFMDDAADIVQSTPNFSNQSLNSLKWDFIDLRPLETREITLVLNVNSPMETPAVNAGTILKYTAKISSTQTDETPADNTFSFDQAVVNSFDPNDKTCVEGNLISKAKVGDYMHYIIRFENTGTYAAQNIAVKDVIDAAKYDINSLVPLSGSHLFSTEISDGNKVEFKFENINLPFDDAHNDGYLAFKIKTKSTLAEGDTFGNAADIFFDYNSAITTNVPITEISKTLGKPDFPFNRYFALYPNPANETLNINAGTDIRLASIQIYNVLGQLVRVVSNAENVHSIDVSALPSGNYFIKIVSDKGTSNSKFIKK